MTWQNIASTAENMATAGLSEEEIRVALAMYHPEIDKIQALAEANKILAVSVPQDGSEAEPQHGRRRRFNLYQT
jgi:hypothetical protein